MPLDNQRKINHLQTMVQKAWTGRQKTVVLVILSGGVYSYSAVTVIFRYQDIVDPTIPNLSGAPPTTPSDVVMIAPLTTSFVGVVYVADTATVTAAAVQAANKYEIIEAVPVGIIPGGTHYAVSLRRLR